MKNGNQEIWRKLLSSNRVSFLRDAKGNPRKTIDKFELREGQLEEFRTQFETDYCRIIFSTPFRRLAGKTQVHPFSEIDYIHNRLTHSLEVSSVAHSLAKRVGRFIAKDRGDIEIDQINDLCWIVRSAGLAHDIGNPPFGHVGEDAIRVWAKNLNDNDKVILDDYYLDFERFDGNAQGFRMLSRPNLRNTTYYRLTAASLGAMVKYPFLVDDDRNPYLAKIKFGAFASERKIFNDVMDCLGLRQLGNTHRHPLSYLTEAADDICYRVSDLEDAVVMGILNEKEVRELFLDGMNHDQEQAEQGQPLQHVRARSIGYLIDDFANCFISHYDEIMGGNFAGDLKSAIDTRWRGVLKRIDELYEKVFAERKKVLTEVGAYHRFTNVLNGFKSLWETGEIRPYDDLPFMCKRIVDLAFGSRFYQENETQTPQWWAHCILDHVVGMTDEYMLTMSTTIA